MKADTYSSAVAEGYGVIVIIGVPQVSSSNVQSVTAIVLVDSFAACMNAVIFTLIFFRIIYFLSENPVVLTSLYCVL